MRSKVSFIVALLLLSGCSMAPEYERPDTYMVMANWSHSSDEDSVKQELPNWRTFVKAEQLATLIELGLENNKQLSLEVLKVAELQSKYRIEDAKRYPTLGATLGEQSTKDLDDQVSATIGLTNYEIDLFGRLDSLSQEAMEDYLAQDNTRRSQAIITIATIITGYLQLIEDNELLSIEQAKVNAYKQQLSLAELRYNKGYTQSLTLLIESKDLLHQAQVQLATYQTMLAQDYNLLRQSVGSSIDKRQLFNFPSIDAELLSKLDAGVSSRLLLNRPDILAAEHDLKAKNARIGAARAAFFPSIQLTTELGYKSNSLASLFSSGASTWSFMPSVSIPIFDWGSKEADLNVQKIMKEKSIISYQQVIEVAFQEVHDALSGQEYGGQKLFVQRQSVKSHERDYQLTKLGYEKGYYNNIELLNKKVALLNSKQDQVKAQHELLMYRVDLYKSLGGGWDRSSASEAISATHAMDTMGQHENE